MKKVGFGVLLFLYAYTSFAQVKILYQAHAHNDYEHKKPLFEALSLGFISIEADIHLVDGQLLVSHNKPKLGEAKTLRESYLEPLRKRILANQGKVYPNTSIPLYLMIDIKTDAQSTYQVLKEQLTEYQEIITYWKHGQENKGAVLVFLSGNRPVDTVINDTLRFVALDGRLEDLDRHYPNQIMPVISENYTKIFKWKGSGQMPQEEVEKLKNLTTKTNQQGKKLRFWASPENENVWKTLMENNVGLIGTDQLERLSRFLHTYRSAID
ncbi:MAG: phosphatidylinositol-specific phospholipase C/glycerophosphodiester phosphodiesterase family protein [Thermoflexibacter sp.]